MRSGPRLGVVRRWLFNQPVVPSFFFLSILRLFFIETSVTLFAQFITESSFVLCLLTTLSPPSGCRNFRYESHSIVTIKKPPWLYNIPVAGNKAKRRGWNCISETGRLALSLASRS